MTPRRFLLGLLHLIRLLSVRQLASIEKAVMKVREPVLARSRELGRDNGLVAVIITTFEARQEECCLPLISAIRAGGCEWPIVIAVNGNLASTYSVPKRQRFFAKASRYGDTSFIAFRAFTSLSRMWNLAIQASAADVCIVLNDDLAVNSVGVMTDFVRLVDVAKTEGIALGNNSFSHFCVSRDVVERMRWFDERFIGVGQEDGDFAWRYEREFGRIPPSLVTPSLRNLSHPSGDELKNGKFSRAPRIFSQAKYVPSESGKTGGRFSCGVIQAIPDFDPHPLSKIDSVRNEMLRNWSDGEIKQYFVA